MKRNYRSPFYSNQNHSNSSLHFLFSLTSPYDMGIELFSFLPNNHILPFQHAYIDDQPAETNIKHLIRGILKA